ncbi:unnamed protein product [Jaminaea pallidilutea]
MAHHHQSTSSTGPANPATTKERHYAQLTSRLAFLNQNVIDLHGHLELAAEHGAKTRRLAVNQAALFMAANAQELDRPNRDEQRGSNEGQ